MSVCKLSFFSLLLKVSSLMILNIMQIDNNHVVINQWIIFKKFEKEAFTSLKRKTMFEKYFIKMCNCSYQQNW